MRKVCAECCVGVVCACVVKHRGCVLPVVYGCVVSVVRRREPLWADKEGVVRSHPGWSRFCADVVSFFSRSFMVIDLRQRDLGTLLRHHDHHESPL
jgi:hypothetical protein